MTAHRPATKFTAERYRELLEITRLITGTLDYRLVLSSVANEATRLLEGDAAAILLLDADAGLRVAASHNIPAECVAGLQIPLGPDVMPSLRTLCADIALPGFVGVPLVLRGETVGVLAVYHRTRHKPRAEDEELLSALADQAAIAIDNARLYEAEQQARREAEKTATRIASLQSITASLSQALTRGKVASVIVDQGIAALGASAGLVALLVEHTSYIEVIDARGYPDTLVQQWRRFPVATRDPVADVVRTGEYLYLESRQTLSARYPDTATPFAAAVGALAALPLLIGGNIIGAIGFSFADSRTFDRDDRSFLAAMAWQCAQALDRARLYEAEQVARKGAEAAQERTAEILEAITDAFFAVDRQWHFVYVNKEAGRLLGGKREDLIGKSIWEEFPQIVGSRFYEEAQRAVAKRAEVTFEAPCPTTGKLVETHLYPSERGLSVYLHEVTERKSG
ncbi:MAG: GAF domain-containing protein [Chloroflexi bacterium]|nr:GAF domain-containing protein [Chloroflexota bacterium]